MKKPARESFKKEIIEEYNTLLKSWGHSDTWTRDQFKTLESMILEVTKIDINVNTLKRFFQQDIGTPQLATREALCIFLGYKDYTDFVIKKTKKDQNNILPEENKNQDNKNSDEEQSTTNENRIEQYSKNVSKHIRRRNMRYFYLIISLLVVVAGYFLYTYKLKDLYINYLISKVEFSASQTRGQCPFTVTFTYNVPSPIFDDITIVYEESNGDILEKKLNKEVNTVNATYIYEGEGFCYLKYKDKEIRKIILENRKAGWSVSVREERKSIFETFPISMAFNKQGYVSIPFDSLPLHNQSNHLFVSYIFYKENLIDCDNFIFEARLRNSPEDHAIPCADIMMYMNSDKGTHGFTMNENCYMYIKFISGETEIKGELHNLERFNFNPSQWHVMTIKVINKETTFYVDGDQILNMGYKNPLGFANELILRFKGSGAVDYVKVSKPDGELVYEENFNEILH